VVPWADQGRLQITSQTGGDHTVDNSLPAPSGCKSGNAAREPWLYVRLVEKCFSASSERTVTFLESSGTSLASFGIQNGYPAYLSRLQGVFRPYL